MATKLSERTASMVQPAIGLSARAFDHACALAGKAIERRNTIPILGMVRCRANGAFEATGTDLDVTVTAKVDRVGSKDATFMLRDYRSVIRAVRAAGGADVALDVSSDAISLRSDSLRVEMKGLTPVDDFPTANTTVGKPTFSATMSHAQLRGLARIAFSISTEETRYYLNGLFLHHLDGANFRAVATDGHRLSMLDMVLPDAIGALKGSPLNGVIIPRRTVRILLDIAGSKPSPKDEGIGIRVAGTNIEFHLGDGIARVEIASKLIDGTFPDYPRVVPATSEYSMLFKTEELRRAVLAASFGSKETRAVRLHFETGSCVVSAYYPDTSITTSVRIDCPNDWKRADDVGVNGRYLMSMLAAAGGDEFLMRTSDPAAPILIRNPADTEWTGVLMPMRV